MRRFGRALLASALFVAATAALVVVPTSTGHTQVPMECDAFNPTNGVRIVSYDPITKTASWAVNGSGICTGGSLNENFNVSFTGVGTSTALGLCTQDLPTTDLKLFVTATFSNSNRTVTQAQVWTVPLAIQPTSVPFTVSGEAVGAGVASTRIFLKCPGSGGSDAARFVWAQTGP